MAEARVVGRMLEDRGPEGQCDDCGQDGRGAKPAAQNGRDQHKAQQDVDERGRVVRCLVGPREAIARRSSGHRDEVGDGEERRDHHRHADPELVERNRMPTRVVHPVDAGDVGRIAAKATAPRSSASSGRGRGTKQAGRRSSPGRRTRITGWSL